MMLMNANEYLETVEQVKQEIRTAQYRAAVQANCELLRLYHAIGTVINAHKVWGSRFVENLAADIKLSFPEMKGYVVPPTKEDLAYVVHFRKTCQRYQIDFAKADPDERDFVIHMAEKTFLQKRA